jgi:putative membrane-bound dehydrogenase-like protein
MLRNVSPCARVAVAALGVGLACLAGTGSARAQVTPEQSAKMLRPAVGLEATLWAAEPMVVNPTTMDIDSRGRVWITEGLNYRLSRAGRQFRRIEDADKIKILEDTDGDGKADKMTVFADKVFPVPMGLAVEENWSKEGKYLGCKVYVGNSPDLLVLEDTDGDDKADKRYPLLTGFGGIDSDHGVHGMVLGIDGKLYFTHGDGCCSVQQDHSEKTQNFDVTDRSGRHVSSDQLANTLRVNRDGTGFEIIADRQRNNYETALNSFGNGFTSDNDDDGNRGSRVIWVMDGGHYGYRTPGSARHWGEDTPGPVPKLVGTGNGSPCGLMVYEGNLFPKEYQGALMEAEAGPRVINFFPLERHGAAFRTEHRVMLGSDDPWFRPVDVTAAPDGSVFVADWYDGGVGGHAFRDQTTGRIYRVAPKGAKPKAVKVDFSTVPGLIEALKSPVVATRDAAQRVLIGQVKIGAKAVGPGEIMTAAVEGREILDVLLSICNSPKADAVVRARATWTLARIWRNAPPHTVASGLLGDPNPVIREMAVRIFGRDLSRNGHVVFTNPETKGRLHAEENLTILLPLANDPDPGVRRELILAFRDMPTAKVGEALKTLAKGWDGQDRWYLEALGLALENRESTFLNELFDGSLFGDLNLSVTGREGSIAVPPYFPADRNEAYIKTGTPDGTSNALGKTLGLAWRLHRPEALPLIAKLLPAIDAPELKGAANDVLTQFKDKNAAVVLADLIVGSSDKARKNELMSILARKIGGDWKNARGDAKMIATIESALKDPGLRIEAIRLAAASFDGRYGSTLLDFARDPKLDEETRVAAIDAITQIRPNKALETLDPLVSALKGKDASNPIAEAALRAVSGLGSLDQSSYLAPMITGHDYPLGLRREALRIYGRMSGGGLKVIALARDGKLPDELKTEATTLVHRDADRRVRSEADKVLPMPTTASGRPLPSVAQLVTRQGNADRGRAVFHRTGTNACASCHRVQGFGQWIGPDLSTIGSKYGKAELIQSILNPSAAIGYNFRTTVASTNDGQVISGLLVEEAPDRVVLKTAEGRRISLRPADIEGRKQSEVSLMPEGLAQTMSDTDLVDLLAFLGTLRQPVSIVGQYQVAAPAFAGETPSTGWRKVTADAESLVALRPISGEDSRRSANLKTGIYTPEAIDAQLVLDSKAAVTATLNGEPVTLRAEGEGPRTARVKLARGENVLLLKVPGGSQGGLVTTFVANKPLEFR